MTPEEKVMLQYKVDNEGFDYCFIHYSDFSEVNDPEFHRLREKYVEAHNALWDYLDMDSYDELE